MVRLKCLLLLTLIATSSFAARNPMYYWYDWKEVTEKDPAVGEIDLGWEDNDWRIDIELDRDAIDKNRLLLLNTGITRAMCEKAAFPMVLMVSYGEQSWRGLCPVHGEGFVVDNLAQINGPEIAPVFSGDTGTYLIWLPYKTD